VPGLVIWLALVARAIGTHGRSGMVSAAHYHDLVELAQRDLFAANELCREFGRNTTLTPAEALATTLRLHVEEAIAKAIGDAIRASLAAKVAA